eukprot:214709_1
MTSPQENTISNNQCILCHQKFGLFRGKHACKRCHQNVCDSCSSRNRYIVAQRRMRRVCDICLKVEQTLIFNSRLKALKLDYNEKNRASIVINIDQNSHEYANGLVNGCKIIAINDGNVELWSSELIIDKLNQIKIPFSITLDYANAEIGYDTLQTLKKQAIDNNWLGLGRYVFMWQYLENDGKWKDNVYNVAHSLQKMNINAVVQYARECNGAKWKYTVMKRNEDECTQTNDDTRNQRDVRRIIFDTETNKRIVWRFRTDNGGWSNIPECDRIMQLLNLKPDKSMKFERGPWQYEIKKIDEKNAIQTNIISNTSRELRLIRKNKSEMDETFQSKVFTKSKHYVDALNTREYISCICGVMMTKMRMRDVYEEPYYMTCHKCKQQIKKDNDIIYHCNKGNCDEHKDGYNLCVNCSIKQNNTHANMFGNYVINKDNEVIVWLTNDLKLPQYIDMFVYNGFDEMNTVIHTINLDTLVQLGMKKIGHRQKVMVRINAMKKEMKEKQQSVPIYETQLTLSNGGTNGGYIYKNLYQQKIFAELSKNLQTDIENYQMDFIQRNTFGKLKELQIFYPCECEAVRIWTNFKKQAYQKMVEMFEDDDDDEENEIIYKLLFDVIIECYHILNNEYINVSNGYVYGHCMNIVLMNIELFYNHVIKTKSKMKQKRFENIRKYLNSFLNKIHDKIDKYKYSFDDLNFFIIQCCVVLWNVIGYQYRLYPLTFKYEMEQKYNCSVHGRTGDGEGDIIKYCVVPAIQKGKTYHSKIWVICNEIDDD